jgi:lipopolysaccharide export LptBFGC system permease protein LptF
VLREARKKRGEEHAPLAPSNLTGTGREVRSQHGKDRSDSIVTVEVLNHGYQVSTVAITPGGDVSRVTEPLRIVRTPIETWEGFVTPAVLESRRLGNGVLRMGELSEAARLKPELEVERWSRMSEWVMGLVLVLLCVPFMVSEKHGQLFEISLVLLVVVAYASASVFIVGWARGGELPAFAPMAVHGLALLAGAINYWFRMET